jgi:hypothetical protein
MTQIVVMSVRQTTLERFRKSKESSARVRVSFVGLPGSPQNQRPVSAYFDGCVINVDGEEDAIIIAGGSANNIHMRLTDCAFQNVAFGAPHDADVADMEAVVQITFPTGEVCVVSFYRPLN